MGWNFRAVPQVPFADHAGRVAGRLQSLGERRLGQRQADVCRFGGVPG